MSLHAVDLGDSSLHGFLPFVSSGLDVDGLSITYDGDDELWDTTHVESSCHGWVLGRVHLDPSYSLILAGSFHLSKSLFRFWAEGAGASAKENDVQAIE